MAITLNKPQVLSDAEIAEWESKDKFKRKVQKFEYAKESGSKEVDAFYVVKPDRVTVDAVTETAKTNLTKGNDLTINACVLAGDMASLEWDDDLYYGLLADITQLMDAKKKK